MKKIYILLIAFFVINFANAQWQKLSLAYNVRQFYISGNNIFAATQNGGVQMSSDNGNTWIAKNTGLTTTDVYAITASGSNMYIGTINGVYISSNNGNNWTAVNTGITDTWIKALIVNGSNIFAGTFGGKVFLSTNNGSSWTATTTFTGSEITSLAIIGNYIFVGTAGELFSSTNNGNTWISNGFTSAGVEALAVNGNNIYVGTIGGGAYLSTNNGNNWTAVNTGITNYVYGIYAFAFSGNNILAGTYYGVYLSTNNCASWSVLSTGLSNKEITSLAVNGSFVFAGTNGIETWKLPLSQLGIKEINNSENNIKIYPIPTKDELTIEINGNKEKVSYEIYNSIGQSIYKGNFIEKTTVQTSSFAQGVYVIKLNNGNVFYFKKIIKE